MSTINDTGDIPLIADKVWTPKNPEVSLEAVEDKPMTDEEWSQSCFPHFDIPSSVTTHVDIEAWKGHVSTLSLSMGETSLLDAVLTNLVEGCNSNVGFPGNEPSVSRNNFSDPATDIPRIIDALATEVKAGHMAGPFPVGYIKKGKVNGFISVSKPGGARRQVGNLSAPRGSSFNEGIPDKTLQQWRVFQTTSRQFAEMIARSGKDSVMSCSDMVSAYKNLPVCLQQRRLQVFRLLGREFVDLRIFFGKVQNPRDEKRS